MSHDTEEWCQIRRKTDLFQNWQKLGKFWPDYSKVSKIWTLICPFWEKYIKFGLKKYRRIVFHDTEESCKIEENLTWDFGNDMMNLPNFTRTLESV